MIIDANTIFGFWPTRKVDISLDRLLSVMKTYKIDKALTISAKAIFYDFREGNEETYLVAQQYPQLVPIFTIDPRKYFYCEEEIEKRARQGFRVIRLFPTLQNWTIDTVFIHRLLTKIGKEKLILMIEAENWGTANQIVRYITRLYSITTILIGISYFNLSEVIELIKHTPNLYIESKLLNTADALEILVKEAKVADRIIFGSGSPLNYIESPLKVIQSANIDEKQKRWILFNNINRLIKTALQDEKD